MKFDYCEIEPAAAENLDVCIGCRFDDEPEELYVIQLDVSKAGSILEKKLLFNGMDCKYDFKVEETAMIVNYLKEMLPE